MNQIFGIKHIIKSFVDNTPDIRGVILTNSDGLPLASTFLSNLDEDKTAAITVSLISLGEKFKKDLEIGEVEKIFIEGKEGYCVITNCGSDLTILVLASTNIVKGWLFVEIKNLAKTIRLMEKAKSIRENNFLANIENQNKEQFSFPSAHGGLGAVSPQ